MAKCSAIALALLGAVLLNILGHCEMSVYPGLRRKPLRQLIQQQQQQQQQPFDVSSDYLTQLMEENARRRLQHTLEQQLERIHMQINRQRQREEQRERLSQRLQLLAAENAAEENRFGELMGGGAADDESASMEIGGGGEDDNYNDNANRYQYNSYRNYDNNNNNNNNNFNNNNNNFNNNKINRNRYVDPNGYFSYKLPPPNMANLSPDLLHERIPFAVGPNDPRFFVQDNTDEGEVDSNSDELDAQALDEYQEFVPAETQNVDTTKLASAANGALVGAAPANNNAPSSTLPNTDNAAVAGAEKLPVLAPAPVEATKLGSDGGAATFHRIKPQNVAAAAAVAGANVVAAMKPSSQDGTASDHISALYHKLQKEGSKSSVVAAAAAAPVGGHGASGHDGGDNLVVRQHMGVDGEMGMYLVALIAGVSAAVTVGVIALGIAWYTLHRKSKAAADVEYPAYGVTGPNKDISPSGDRKLAQSAQMYHYQHQKQQIIAMENRQAAEGSCGMSDVESDDEENEEGDYTVYECPGLAPPMGEMEVKNPLFLDETPLTPASNNNTAATAATTSAPPITSNITQTTLQQPPTQQLGSKRPTTNFKVVGGAAPTANSKTTSAESTKSSEENGKKKNNKK